MIIRHKKIRRGIAFFFLGLLTLETLLPVRSWALTSGPSQPESKQFMAYNTSDMVDLFTGGFKYNIPILDVDGYPVNLNYQSGVGMDDEASWVGLGWNLNVGAINRQLRGIPDDMSGDSVVTEHYTAPKITYGGRLNVKGEVVGLNVAKLSGSLTLGVFSDNYTGIGAELGVNAGVSVGIASAGSLTIGLGGGVSLLSNTSSGVDVTPSISLSVRDHMQDKGSVSMGISASLGYNSRQGLKDLSLSQSFEIDGGRRISPDPRVKEGASLEGGNTSISFNTPSFYPQSSVPYRSSSQTYSMDWGAAYFAVFAGVGVTGYKNKREILSLKNKNYAFGSLYAHQGTDEPKALMDFMREKENPIIPHIPNLPLPIATPDIFSFSGQTGGGQFRLYRGSTGVFFDPEVRDISNDFSAGGDLGGGAYFHGGVNFYHQDITNITRKWKDRNGMLAYMDHKTNNNNPAEEQAYFKVTGEKNAVDAGYEQKIKGEQVVSVSLNGRAAQASLHDKYNREYAAVPYKKDSRQVRRTAIAYLTAKEAEKAALDTVINNYAFNQFGTFAPKACGQLFPASRFLRNSGHYQPHHISEITVQDENGGRSVYGIPVYNYRHDEYTFAVNPGMKSKPNDTSRNLIGFNMIGDEIEHNGGIDKYYHHQSQPPYASSYLLTAVLSPDYVDVTNNGITDDDRGTAVKFNYSRVAATYQWRSPYEANKALYNKGLAADTSDDKGNLVYGEKELWYVHSIETKTKIAYFITDDRDDALGVTGVQGAPDKTVRQRRLREIRLYSKSDLSKPIKTAVFEYDYSLCPGVPNQVVAGAGKLTLKKVYFKYGSSTKGQYHPYQFDYNTGQGYALLSMDRWGTLKPVGSNAAGGFGSLRNDEFPYAVQDRTAADKNAAMWNLSKITLPTGGEIKVDYESNDYAYVQDRKAMEMVNVLGLIKDIGGTPATGGLTEARGIKIRIPGPMRDSLGENVVRYFVDDYLNGSREFYTRTSVDVSDFQPAPLYDFISCYATIDTIKVNTDNTMNVLFKTKSNGGVTGNPISFATWQKMRLEYPMYAYPGYRNRISDDQPVEAAITAIANAFGNFSELRENFYERAARKGFGNRVNLNRSFVRVAKANGRKLGGGARVKRVQLADNWNTMAGGGAPNAAYGQYYDYTTTINGKTISSGVAAYEPGTGSDENPMRMPVPYSEESKGALSNYFYLEEPFGESLYPAPQIGYSEVKVYDLDAAGNADPARKTGWQQHEFYTARDFPVITDYEQGPQNRPYGPSGWGSYVGAKKVYELASSQGYAIWLNDMHGKPKAERVFNQGGQEISSVVYYYKSEGIDAGKFRLSNKVATIDEKGKITAEEVIGREIEMFADMRQQETINDGKAVQLGIDIIPFFFGITLPIPHWPVKDNDDYKLFRSAVTFKTIQNYGILDRVVKTINGSTVTTTNLLFDRNTGQPVVTSITNEFDDPVYNVNIPAYWAYTGMGGAYKNINTVFKGFTTDAGGKPAGTIASLLAGGDELVDVGSGARMWAIYSGTAAAPDTKVVRIISDAGSLVKNFKGDVKVCRSGYRNQLTAGTASLVTLRNPIVGNRLAVLDNAEAAQYKITDAKAVLYDEGWGARVCNCPDGYVASDDGKECWLLPQEVNNDTLNIIQGDKVQGSYGKYGTILELSSGGQASKTGQGWDSICFDASSSAASTYPTMKSGWDTVREARARTTRNLNEVALMNEVKVACGPLNSCGIWLNDKARALKDRWLGLEVCITIPAEGIYAMGYGADNLIRIYIDDVLIRAHEQVDESTFQLWRIFNRRLTAGKHKLRLEFMNATQNGDPGAAAVGFEIYNHTTDYINNLSREDGKTYLANDGNRIFSTIELTLNRYKPNTFIRDANGAIRLSKYYCTGGRTPDVCHPKLACDVISAANILNPYISGFLGNWRPAEEKVFQMNRTDQQIFNAPGAGLNLRNSGYLINFTSIWYYDAAKLKWDVATVNKDKWITSRYITLYDEQGQETENRDALGRYSSATYAFKGTLPAAVAANAMQREIFYDGFEDYKFRSTCGDVDACKKDSFNIAAALGSDYMTYISTDNAHTGRYSLKLNKTLKLATSAHTMEHGNGVGRYLNNNNDGEFMRKLIPGLYPKGFSPVPSKKYVFSAWVKDNDPFSNNAGFTIDYNNPVVKARVEGWKLVELELNSSAGEVILNIYPNGTVYLDDIRIFPYDANIKSYAYDERSLRLMAELDENNFATFYEYDDEGSLIRVKKETDRGIMTLKENRSVFRKR